jgi:hypothetical protein
MMMMMTMTMMSTCMAQVSIPWNAQCALKKIREGSLMIIITID